MMLRKNIYEYFLLWFALYCGFSRKHNVNNIPLAHLVGNRSNVLFYDAELPARVNAEVY